MPLGHKAGQARAKLGQAVGRTHTMQAGRAGADQWATEGFGPLTLFRLFQFSVYIQINANSKICTRFI
jgi:hypothetical protein